MSTDHVKAKSPAAEPATVATGLVIAVLLLAAAVVLVRDALVDLGALTGDAWLPAVVGQVDVVEVSNPWLLWGGLGVAVIGLVLVVAALKPRRSTHWATSAANVYIGRDDAARIAANAAHDTPAVVDARASVAGRRRIRVRTTTISTDTAAVGAQVDQAAQGRLAALAPTPSIRSDVTLEEN